MKITYLIYDTNTILPRQVTSRHACVGLPKKVELRVEIENEGILHCYGKPVQIHREENFLIMSDSEIFTYMEKSRRQISRRQISRKNTEKALKVLRNYIKNSFYAFMGGESELVMLKHKKIREAFITYLEGAICGINHVNQHAASVLSFSFKDVLENKETFDVSEFIWWERNND